MKIYTTAPLEDPREARRTFRELEDIGYDGAFSFEAKHDPFLPLVLAAEHTQRLQLGTAVAIAFARNPMNLANLAYGIQLISEGRFLLGLGSQVAPHIRNRFSMPWSEPARRMRELILAIKAIFARWEGQAELAFEGDFYRHTLMIPAFDPGPNVDSNPQSPKGSSSLALAPGARGAWPAAMDEGTGAMPEPSRSKTAQGSSGPVANSHGVTVCSGRVNASGS